MGIRRESLEIVLIPLCAVSVTGYKLSCSSPVLFSASP